MPSRGHPACGYEGQNDADRLRHDPLVLLDCGRVPDHAPPLAGQSTFARVENAPTRADCYRIAIALGALSIRERARQGIPTRIVLDCDATDDPAHGQQEEVRYHGYDRQHMYHPPLVFDGEIDQVVSAVPRAGNAHAGKSALAVLKRIVRHLRVALPGDGLRSVLMRALPCQPSMITVSGKESH